MTLHLSAHRIIIGIYIMNILLVVYYKVPTLPLGEGSYYAYIMWSGLNECPKGLVNLFLPAGLDVPFHRQKQRDN